MKLPRGINKLAARWEVFDPGLIRIRYGTQTVCAVALTWATMKALTTLLSVADSTGIPLFGAAVCFFGALLITDPRLGSRVRSAGFAAIVSALAVVATGYLGGLAQWAIAAFILLLMFLSFGLRRWSLRAGAVSGIGALAAFIAGAGSMTVDRMGWLVLASTVGFAWLAIGQRLVLPDDSTSSLTRCLNAFGRRAAEAVVLVAEGGSRKALSANVDRIRTCRAVIDSQLVALASAGVEQRDVDQLRVELYSVLAGVEQLATTVVELNDDAPLADSLSASLKALLEALVVALTGDDAAVDIVVRDAPILLDQVRQAPPGGRVAATIMTESADLAAQSMSRARELAATVAVATRVAAEPAAKPSSHTFPPTLAMAVQAVVAAVAAGLIAKWLGNDQSRVVAWTAFLVIAGSAGESTRRAWTRIVATILGVTAGVVIAAIIPQSLGWLVAVVLVGMFCTIVAAPVSYARMVFWLSVAVIPLSATEGLYLDLIKDRAIAALIGGCVAAVVALTVMPVRHSCDLRPALEEYLDALDDALVGLLPGHDDRRAGTVAELDRTHRALDAIAESATAEVHLLPQPGGAISEQRSRVDAVHEAFLGLAPLLTDSARLLLGWTGAHVVECIERLRLGARTASAAADAQDPAESSADASPFVLELSDDANQVTTEVHQRMLNFYAALDALTASLRERPLARFR